jgi:hypothetical protein
MSKFSQASGGDRHGDLQVRGGLRAGDGRRRDPGISKQLVKQHPRPGTGRPLRDP